MKKCMNIILYVLAGLGGVALCAVMLVLSFSSFMREDTEVYRVASPDRSRYAMVVESDQGALGGATYVYVMDAPGKILGFSGGTERIYSGRWGEAEHMQIAWRDNGVLIINGEEYPVPS